MAIISFFNFSWLWAEHTAFQILHLTIPTLRVLSTDVAARLFNDIVVKKFLGTWVIKFKWHFSAPRTESMEAKSAPEFVKVLHSCQVAESGTATLTCQVKGHPTPEVTWSCAGKPVKESGMLLYFPFVLPWKLEYDLLVVIEMSYFSKYQHYQQSRWDTAAHHQEGCSGRCRRVPMRCQKFCWCCLDWRTTYSSK